MLFHFINNNNNSVLSVYTCEFFFFIKTYYNNSIFKIIWIQYFSWFNLAVNPQSNMRHRCDQTYLLKVRWRLWWRGRWQEPQRRFGKLVIQWWIKSQQSNKGVEGKGEKLFFSCLRSPAENKRGEKVQSSQQELRKRRRRGEEEEEASNGSHQQRAFHARSTSSHSN